MERWLTAMSDQFTIEQPQDVPIPATSDGYTMPISPTQDNNTYSPRVGMEAQVPSEMYAWQPRDGVHTGSSYETHLRPPEIVSSPVYSRDQATAGSEGVASPAGGQPAYANVSVTGEGSQERVPGSRGRQSTRAEELSKSKPSIYF